MLVDSEIRALVADGSLKISPFDERLVRGGSLCLRLGYEALVPKCSSGVDIKDLATYPSYVSTKIDATQGFELTPRAFVLAATMEKIALPLNVGGWISNLSGLARLGLQVVFSSWITPGYGSATPTTLTLEIYNALDVGVKIYPGMRICHIVFFPSVLSADAGYDTQVGTYSGQEGPRTSQFYREFARK